MIVYQLDPIDVWRELHAGQHALGLVMLVLPTDAGMDSDELQAVLSRIA